MKKHNIISTTFVDMKNSKSTTKKRFLLTISTLLSFSLITPAQVTAVPCDMLGMSVNVGSQEAMINIYHSGQYLTHPQSENIFMWEFTDQQGNIVHQETLVDESTISFGHSWSLSDTINVTVHFVNDSANLDNWYISQGLPTNGNSINCLFEDQIYWETGDPTPWGSWTFIQNNPGIDVYEPPMCIDANQIDPTVFCPEIFEPVCGCDGITYSNSCHATYSGGVTSWEDGPCIPFSVHENNLLSCSIYPNPASNNLTVDLGDFNGVNTTIKLYDGSSKLVLEKQSISTLMIDVSGFAKGMYSLELATDEYVVRSQVIIE